MASPKIKVSRSARKKMHQMTARQVRAAAEKIAAACNAESSWGFYKAYHGDDASRVAVLTYKAEDGRSNRLLRNMERGRL